MHLTTQTQQQHLTSKIRAVLLRSVFKRVVLQVSVLVISLERYLWCAAICALIGCAQSDKHEKEQPLLKIGNSVLFPSELSRSIKYSSQSDSATQAALFLEDWRRTMSLYEQAIEAGEHQDEETQRLVEKSRQRIIAERFVERKLQDAFKNGYFRIDSLEVKNYYEKMSSTLVFHEARFKLLRIYTTNTDAALRLRQALVANVKMDSLFKLVMAKAPETAELNQIAFENAVQLKTLPQLHLESENLWAVLERMKPKDVSPIMKLSDSLFVVMRLEESVLPQQPKTLAQAFPEIIERLRLMKQKHFVDSLVSRLKNSL